MLVLWCGGFVPVQKKDSCAPKNIFYSLRKQYKSEFIVDCGGALLRP